MKAWLLLVVLGAVSGPCCLAQDASTGLPDSYEELETVIITGERPGPALWKVRHKEHTLWILPTYGPLPQELVWRSGQLEAVVRDSQEVYFLTHINAPSRNVSEPALLQAFQNADGKSLRDILPAGMHQQFTDLAQRYAGDSAVFERLRPWVATDSLRQVAMQRLKLTSERAIAVTVQEMARKHGVKNISARLRDPADWDRMIAELARTPREKDIPCARARLDRLETDLRAAVARANAWATGDIDALRNDPNLYVEQADSEVCAQSLQQLKLANKRNLDLRRVSYTWSVRALKKNRSTLVLVPVTSLFGAQGLMEKFRAAGYRIEEP